MNTSICLVGCGAWGKHILRDLLTLGVQVAVVNPTRPESLPDSMSYFDVLPAQTFDGYVVATPTATHVAVVQSILAIQPDAKIFVEKPLSLSATEVEVLRPYEHAGQIFVMDKWRYHSGIIAMRQAIESGVYGPLQSLYTERTQWGLVYGSDENPLARLVPHDLTIGLEFRGYLPPVTQVYGEYIQAKRVGLTFVLQDTATGYYQHSTISLASPRHSRYIRAYCRDAMIVLAETDASELLVYTDVAQLRIEQPPAPLRIPIAPNMPLLDELALFVAYVQGIGVAPKSSLSDAFAVVDHIDTILVKMKQ